MKYFYIAITIKQDRNENIFTGRTPPEYSPGYYSYIIKCTQSENIKCTLEKIGGLISANIYPTKKQAADTVARWNSAYKANNEYLFDSPAF